MYSTALEAKPTEDLAAPSRTNDIPFYPANIPEGLKDCTQWMVWKSESSDGRVNKAPRRASDGVKASKVDPANFATFADAVSGAHRHGLSGIGICLTDGDEIVALDLDDCVDPETGEIKPCAQEIIDDVDSYTELSPSGRGVHIFCTGTLLRNVKAQGLEMYSHKSFVTVTGDVIHGADLQPAQPAIDAILKRYAPPDADRPLEAPQRPSGGSLTDESLLSKARANKTTGVAFKQLYDHGDWSGYRSRSEAHYAHCGMLGFWTGGDLERVLRLFWQSALAKTVERPDPEAYIRRTAEKALKSLRKFYTPRVDEATKVKIRSLAERHIKWIETLDFNHRGGELEKKVLIQTTHVASKRGLLTDDGEAIAFHMKQAKVAEAIGTNQRSVGNAIRRLCDSGHLERTLKGYTGKNSEYVLRFKSVETSSTDFTSSYIFTDCVNEEEVNGLHSWKKRNGVEDQIAEGEKHNPQPPYAAEQSEASQEKTHRWDCLCDDCLYAVVMPYERPARDYVPSVSLHREQVAS